LRAHARVGQTLCIVVGSAPLAVGGIGSGGSGNGGIGSGGEGGVGFGGTGAGCPGWPGVGIVAMMIFSSMDNADSRLAFPMALPRGSLL